METQELKDRVKGHWDDQPCGTRGLATHDRRAFFEELERERYSLEPYIRVFADFERGRGRKVLEVGIGAGTDFINWVRAGATASGIDLTDAGVALARERLALEGLKAELGVADAEHLPFPDESFDIVYSWGVLHHTPDTRRAVAEVHRVLKREGRAVVMIYHVPSWTGFLLWGLHCAGRLRPWKSPRWAIAHYLESPGTKAYTVAEAERLFSMFRSVKCRTQLSHGDLLLMRPSERYQGRLHRLLWAIYPRWLVRLSGNRLGLGLLIEAVR